MAGFETMFDPTTGRITWQTMAEDGSTFSLTLGPSDTKDGLYIRIESNGSVLYETSITL